MTSEAAAPLEDIMVFVDGQRSPRYACPNCRSYPNDSAAAFSARSNVWIRMTPRR